jgi:hypothetical protein
MNMSDELTNLPEEGLPEDLGGTFITLTDDEGNDIELEYLDTLEYGGNIYMAFFPVVPEDADPNTIEEDDEYGLIILKVVTVDGEDQLETIDNEEELEAVYERFSEELFEDEDEDEEES